MTWAAVWGSGDQLDSLQMAVRAVFFFLLLLALIRIGGTRIFARMSAFDNVVVIVLGAVAARWKGVASCLYREGILDADALAKTRRARARERAERTEWRSGQSGANPSPTRGSLYSSESTGNFSRCGLRGDCQPKNDGGIGLPA